MTNINLDYPTPNLADLIAPNLTRISVPVSFTHVHDRVVDLARQLRESRIEIQGIVAIRQGGAVPAKLLAAELQIPEDRIASVRISRYAADGKAYLPRVLSADEIPNSGQGWVIVDEMGGTGDTLMAANALYPHASIAVLHSYSEALERKRSDGTPLIDYHSQKVGSHIWIVYPWEHD